MYHQLDSYFILIRLSSLGKANIKVYNCIPRHATTTSAYGLAADVILNRNQPA